MCIQIHEKWYVGAICHWSALFARSPVNEEVSGTAQQVAGKAREGMHATAEGLGPAMEHMHGQGERMCYLSLY